MPALGYASVPGGVALDGAEIEAQRAGIESACGRLGLELVSLVRDHERDGDGGRPGLLSVLERIEAGEASCLVVNDLERLSRQVGELAGVIDRLERRKARLIALDVGLDTATPSGRLALAPADAAAAEPDAAEPADAAAAAATAAEPASAEPPPDAAQAEPGESAAAGSLAEAAPAEPPAETAPGVPAVAAPSADAAPAEPAVAEPSVVAPAEPAVAEPPAEAAVAAAPNQPAPPGAGPARGQRAVLALGYASVPAEGKVSQSLDQQRLVIEREAARLGFELVEVVREREPKTGRALDRAGLSYLIGRIAAGDAACVVVSALDRLSRSVAELGTIVQWLQRNDVRLVAADIDLDTASPGGRTTALALASVARWEHERVSERTRSGLAAARAKRHAAAGPDWVQVRERIAKMRADGMTLQAIADVLNAEGVPTQRGGTEWRPSSVQTAAGYKRRTRSKQLDDLPTVGNQARTQSKPDSGDTPVSGK